MSVPPWWNSTPASTRTARRASSNGCKAAAKLTTKLGLECHAGHGLTYDNVGPIAAIPEVMELNIGHFIIAQAVFDGLPAVVKKMKELMIKARQ